MGDYAVFGIMGAIWRASGFIAAPALPSRPEASHGREFLVPPCLAARHRRSRSAPMRLDHGRIEQDVIQKPVPTLWRHTLEWQTDPELVDMPKSHTLRLKARRASFRARIQRQGAQGWRSASATVCDIGVVGRPIRRLMARLSSLRAPSAALASASARRLAKWAGSPALSSTAS